MPILSIGIVIICLSNKKATNVYLFLFVIMSVFEDVFFSYELGTSLMVVGLILLGQYVLFLRLGIDFYLKVLLVSFLGMLIYILGVRALYTVFGDNSFFLTDVLQYWYIVPVNLIIAYLYKLIEEARDRSVKV
jgi:hypothetical protein